MEDVMSNSVDEHSPIESIFGAVANWVTRYRQAAGLRRELAKCGPEEVAAIARDIGMSIQELALFASKGPNAADELPKLLRALGVDPQKLLSDRNTTLRDLQRICITCGNKVQCKHELAAGTAATHYHDYCPNALSLDELFRSRNP
jgi:transcriptional regulator with XRE-family HTH domain